MEIAHNTMKKSLTSKGVNLSENKTIIYAITKKDVYLFFFYDLFIATLAYYMFKIKPTMFYECLGITGSILCPLLMRKWR